jgi:hypothetical protein
MATYSPLPIAQGFVRPDLREEESDDSAKANIGFDRVKGI